ncbi:MAG: low-specificity L-threonine aldolase [Bacillota bacterium]
MIDFRSDTVTRPTPAMRKAMFEAVVGDDVYQDDPTVNDLESEAARMLGKEAALFVPSGHMGNQVAIMTHTNRGDEIILGANSHIKTYEVGAAAVLSGVSFHTVPEENGMMDVRGVDHGVRMQDIHYPKTSLICVENAHGSGRVAPLSYMESIRNIADQHSLKVHLDGARIFNAATALEVEAKTIAAYADSVMFCLSKGLSAPIGSMLVGSKAFIERARKHRKMLGGGMRQAGMLAAAGLIALKAMTARLQEDHDNARYLAKKLAGLEGFEVDESALDINMVFVRSPYDLNKLKKELKEEGILLGGYKGEYMRLVCHHDISKDDVDALIGALKKHLGLQ